MGRTQTPKLRGSMNAIVGIDMESSDVQGNEKELASDVMESLGEPKEEGEDLNQSQESVGSQKEGDPLYVQKRLKQQKRAHDREMRAMEARMAELQSQIQPNQNQSYDANPNVQPGGFQSGGTDDAIRKAVSFALQQKDLEEQKAKNAQSQAHIAKQYQDLQRHLDQTADKYDDFDDLVRSDSAPFTAHMRDAALMLPKKGPGAAGEVLYKLGQNPEELNRIAKLHPVDQAAEMVKLSHALISGGDNKGAMSNTRPLGQVKANPATNSVGVTEKTSPATIRALMKAGKFK